MNASRFGFLALLLAGAGSLSAATVAASKNETVILDSNSLWRTQMVYAHDEIMLKSGEVGCFSLSFSQREWRKTKTIEKYKARRRPLECIPAEIPGTWMCPGFDDSEWSRSRAPLLDRATTPWWRRLLMRGKFVVTDPARAKDLTLSVGYKGGLVVYLNGREICRRDMPEGEITNDTLGTPLAKTDYLEKDGYLKGRYKIGVNRSLKAFKIPASRLKVGENTLALSVHRSVAPWQIYTTRWKKTASRYDGWRFGRLAVNHVRFTSSSTSGIQTAGEVAKSKRILVSNASILHRVHPIDYPDPFTPLKPIRIPAVANGTFSGQVVLHASETIRGLKVESGELKGPSTIPASAIEIRYGKLDGHHKVNGNHPRIDHKCWFAGLEPDAPATVPVYGQHGTAIQPIWIRVAVPRNAKLGDYTSTITVRAEGIDPIKVPLEVPVADWCLPNIEDYYTDNDSFQSPESVAMQYKVPFWSKRHWELMEESFKLMKPLRVQSLYITCVRRTLLGNEHAMVRWFRGEDGSLTPDFSIAEKYLDMAVRHLGKIPFVVPYVWEPHSNDPNHEGAWQAQRTKDRDILITVVDPDTGELLKEKGPKWGTAECRAFWKQLIGGLKDLLVKRGMPDSLMMGLLSDVRASKVAMDDITAAWPGLKWVLHAHNYCDRFQGYRMGLTSAFWGIGYKPQIPTENSGFIKQPKHPDLCLMYITRDNILDDSPLAKFSGITELWMSAVPRNRAARPSGVRGISRFGMDFWEVQTPGKGKGKSPWGKSIIGRYPESCGARLCFARGVPALLGVGKNGAIPTARSEAIRENLQQIEARVFIEEALQDEDKQARLGQDLVGRCVAAFVERTEKANRCEKSTDANKYDWPWFVNGYEKRNEKLYKLAAEVRNRLGSAQLSASIEK